MIPLRLKQPGIYACKNVRFYGMPMISLVKGSTIRIGDNCVICSDSRMTTLAVNHPVLMRTLRSEAVITIGANTGISGGTICAATRIEIGKDCLIGANVVIVDTDFHPLNPIGRRSNSNWQDIVSRPIIIGENVFIGAEVLILKGVSIGENSIIGMGSVVTKNVPPNTIVAGNPAKMIRKI